MKFSTKKARFFGVSIGLVLVGLLIFFGSIILKHSQEVFFSSDPDESSVSFYPRLDLMVEHSDLEPANRNQLQKSFETLLDLLEFRETWTKFYPSEHIPNEQNAIRPELIEVMVLPIESYNQMQHGTLYNGSMKDGALASGYRCQLLEDQSTLRCYFFLDDYFFQPKRVELAQLFFTNFFASSLLMMGNVDMDPYLQQELFEELERQVETIIFLKPKTAANSFSKNFQKLLTGNHWLNFKALAQERCSGNLYCQIKQERCSCNDGTACRREEYCDEEYPNIYLCPVSSCQNICSGTDSFDPAQNCWGLDNYPYCIWNSYCHGAGICEGPALGGCSSGGGGSSSPAPTATPPPGVTPTQPPPPDNCPNCCPSDMTCLSGRFPELDNQCSSDEICCINCGYVNYPPRGQVRVWFFYDSNNNYQFDQADQPLPSEIVDNAQLRLYLIDKQCSDGPCTANISASHSMPGGPGIAGTLIENQCNAGLNICDVLNPTFFNTCWAACDPIKAGDDSWDRTVNEDKFFLGDRWFKDTIFWGYYLGGDINNASLNFDNRKLASGQWGDYIAETGAAGSRVNYEVVGLPSQYQVNVIRNQHPMDASRQTTVYDQSTLYNGYIQGVGGSEVREQLVVVGIGLKNDPPQVLNTQITHINNEPISNRDDLSYCSTSDTGTNVKLSSIFFDADEPIEGNLIKNGGFEQPFSSDYFNSWIIEGDGVTRVSGVDAIYQQYSAKIQRNSDGSKARMIKLVPIDDNSLYSLTISHQGYSSESGVQIKGDVYCHNGGGLYDFDSNEVPNVWLNFNQEGDGVVTEAKTFMSGSCSSGKTQVVALFVDSTSSTPVIVDGIILRKNSTTVEPYSDIEHFELNLENQPYSNPGQNFDPLYWPIRLHVNRMTHYGNNPSHYKIFYGPSETGSPIQESAQIKYSFVDKRWYLDSNLTISQNNIPIATLNASNPATHQWRTYFELSDLGSNSKNTMIEAYWDVDVNINLSDYHLTSRAWDFLKQDDARIFNHDMRNTLVLNHLGNSVHFHRFNQLNFFDPTLNINFVDSEGDLLPGGDYCSYEPGRTPITLTSATIFERVSGSTDYTSHSISNQNSATITANSCANEDGTYDITLELDPNDGCVCACNRSDSNPYICTYFDVPASYFDGNDPINFYLTDINLNNSAWFQAVGGQIISAAGIRSPIPWDGVEGPCLIGVSCIPALITNSPWGTGEANTPGFPLTDSGAIRVHATASTSDLIHYNDHRTQSVDAHATEANAFPKEYKYRYFFNRFGFQYQDNSLTNNSLPNLDSRDADLEGNLYVFYHSSDLEINNTNNWSVDSNQKVIVFVDGDLTILDTGDGSKITSVGVGGYLAFIVSGDITIDSSVGTPTPTSAYPASFTPPSVNNTHVEGIFLADGEITIESNNNPNESDKKFIGAGTFVGWTGVNLERNFSDNNIGRAWHNYNPTETFIYRPDFLVNTPRTMKHFLHEWREVAPRLLE